MRVVIVGGVAAGMSAATRLRRLDEAADIVVLESGTQVSFANCGLPYHVGGVIPERTALLRDADGMARRYRLDIRREHTVTAIDREAKRLVVRTGDGSEVEERYDVLVLAGGAIAAGLPTDGSIPVHPLRTVDDMDAIIGAIDGGARTAVVAGGGYIGLETAENLVRRGLRVDRRHAGRPGAAHARCRDGGARPRRAAAERRRAALRQRRARGRARRARAGGRRPAADGSRHRRDRHRSEHRACGERRAGDRCHRRDRRGRAAPHVRSRDLRGRRRGREARRGRWRARAGRARRAGEPPRACGRGRDRRGARAHGPRARHRDRAGLRPRRRDARLDRAARSSPPAGRTASCTPTPRSTRATTRARRCCRSSCSSTRRRDRILGAQIIGSDGVDKRIDVLATAIAGDIRASALSGSSSRTRRSSARRRIRSTCAGYVGGQPRRRHRRRPCSGTRSPASCATGWTLVDVRDAGGVRRRSDPRRA